MILLATKILSQHMTMGTGNLQILVAMVTGIDKRHNRQDEGNSSSQLCAGLLGFNKFGSIQIHTMQPNYFG